MNWDAIGAIGEIVGAVAVVATLVYLSMQIRESQKATVAEGSSKAMELYSNWRTTFLQNTDVSNALAKANVGEELTERERAQLRFLADELFFASSISKAFSLHSGAFYDTEADATYLIDILKTNPGLIPEWHRYNGVMSRGLFGSGTSVDTVSTDFRAQIDAALPDINRE